MVDVRRFIRNLLWKADRLIVKSERAPIAEWTLEPTPAIREPKWNYETLVELAKTNWVVRMVLRAITQEALGPRWNIKPTFKRKCTSIKCGAEYDKEVEICEVCEAETCKPSEAQYQKLERLLEKPNRDYGFEEILRSTIFFDQVLDDWYLSVTYQTLEVNGVKKKVASEIYAEDSRYIRIVADEKGHLGGKEWFCPTCYTPDTYHTPSTSAEAFCPKCRGPLSRTAYVHQVGGAVKARFAADEIIHGSSSRVLPELYGSPKLVSVWKILQIMKVMDDYNWETYSEGKVGSLVLFPGYGQNEVDAISARIESDVTKKDAADITTGIRTGRKKIRTLFLGAKETPSVVKVMEDLKQMQSVEHYKLFRDAVCAVYGVTPVFVSVIESGRAGNNPRMQIDVQNRTTREVQANKEDVINNLLLPKFEITDWYFAFNQIEAEDELRVKEVERTKAETARIYLESGFQVEFDEFGELKISGVAQPLEKREADRIRETEDKFKKLLKQTEQRILSQTDQQVKTLTSELTANFDESLRTHQEKIASIQKSETRRFSKLREELYEEFKESLRERRARRK